MKKKIVFAALVSILTLPVGFMVGSLTAADGTIENWTGMGSRRDTVEMKLESNSLGTAADLTITGDLEVTTNSRLTGTLAVTGASTLTGATTITGAVTASSGTYSGSFRPQLATAITDTLTPDTTGQFIFNMTSFELCISTGVLSSQWQLSSSETSPCSD